jgi:hypothetical protein
MPRYTLIQEFSVIQMLGVCIAKMFVLNAFFCALRQSFKPCKDPSRFPDYYLLLARSLKTFSREIAQAANTLLALPGLLSGSSNTSPLRMLLPHLPNLHAFFHRHQSPSKEQSGPPLSQVFSQTLKFDLRQQHHLHIVDEIKLMTQSLYKADKFTTDLVNLGVDACTARLVLIRNGFDYDKAITMLVTRILEWRGEEPRGEEDRRLSPRAVARLLAVTEMDRVLELMIEHRNSKALWRYLVAAGEIMLKKGNGREEIVVYVRV